MWSYIAKLFVKIEGEIIISFLQQRPIASLHGGLYGGSDLHQLNCASNKVTKIMLQFPSIFHHIWLYSGNGATAAADFCLILFPCFFHIWSISGNHATMIFAWFPSIFPPYMINIWIWSKYILNTHFTDYDNVRKF